MGICFDEVKEEDFLKIGGDKPAHLLIEATLIKIGGEGVMGIEYKKAVLKKAGWKHHELVSYTSKRKDATRVFNAIRLVLEKTEDRDEILELLE